MRVKHLFLFTLSVVTLLYGCKSKHSDYTPSSSLSSKTWNEAINESFHLRVFGELTDPVNRWNNNDDYKVKYYFQICSKSIVDKCANPFIDVSLSRPGIMFGGPSPLDTSHMAHLLEQFDQDISFPYIIYVIRNRLKKGSWPFKNLDYIKLDEHRGSTREEYLELLNSKEKSPYVPNANFVGADDPQKVVYEIRLYQLMEIAHSITKYYKDVQNRKWEINVCNLERQCFSN